MMLDSRKATAALQMGHGGCGRLQGRATTPDDNLGGGPRRHMGQSPENAAQQLER